MSPSLHSDVSAESTPSKAAARKLYQLSLTDKLQASAASESSSAKRRRRARRRKQEQALAKKALGGAENVVTAAGKAAAEHDVPETEELRAQRAQKAVESQEPILQENPQRF